MRTIKFRALKDDISNCNWVYGNLIYDADGNPRIQEKNGDTYFTTCLKGTECQYTGLKDKNGTEIYEGDVDDNGYVVEYDESLSSFICVDEESDEWYHLCDLHTEFDGMNIIGNIHQNKELIKTK